MFTAKLFILALCSVALAINYESAEEAAKADIMGFTPPECPDNQEYVDTINK